MNALDIYLDLSQIGISKNEEGAPPRTVLREAREFLETHHKELGAFQNLVVFDSQWVSDKIEERSYMLQFERKSVKFSFLHHKDAGRWQLKGFWLL